jgi:hypothetical protein
MGLFDRLFGSDRRSVGRADISRASTAGDADAQAIERYRYLVRTAPPEAIEEAHAEAFTRLTPEQRRRVLDELASELPAPERDAVLRAGEQPASLARAATRAELRQPGSLERAFGRVGPAGGIGFGGMMAGSFLGAIAGTVLGTAVANHFLDGSAADAAGEQAFGESADAGDAGAGGDAGGDFGDFGGDSFDV